MDHEDTPLSSMKNQKEFVAETLIHQYTLNCIKDALVNRLSLETFN